MSTSTAPNGKPPWIDALLSQANFIRTRVLALPAMESPEDAAVLRKSHLSKLVATFQEYVSALIDFLLSPDYILIKRS